VWSDRVQGIEGKIERTAQASPFLPVCIDILNGRSYIQRDVNAGFKKKKANLRGTPRVILVRVRSIEGEQSRPERVTTNIAITRSHT
jgi:hypothetical protein